MSGVGDRSELNRRWADAGAIAIEMAACTDATQAAWKARELMLDWPEAPLPPLLAELLLLNDELEETIRSERPGLLPKYRELGYRIAEESERRRT